MELLRKPNTVSLEPQECCLNTCYRTDLVLEEDPDCLVGVMP